MICIDKNFNEVNMPFVIEQIEIGIRDYLQKISLEKNTLENALLNMDNLYIQVSDDNSYNIKATDGSLKKYKIPSNVGACKTNMIIKANSSELNITPGVVLRESYTPHQVVHEILHGISSKQHSYFDENGITYTKTGTEVDYYDKSLNDYEKNDNLSSEGLNEGITEYLASLITNEYNGCYAPYVVISHLFMNSNNFLLNAYFKDDLSLMENFYNDVEDKQSLITREDFMKLNSKSQNFEDISKIISAGIMYNRAYGNEISEEELNFFTEYLDTYSMLDYGSWGDLISCHSISL